jgi:hypothetical protein
VFTAVLAGAAQQNRDIQKAIDYRNWVQGTYVEEKASALPQGSFSGSPTRTFDDSQSELFKGFMGESGSGGSGSGTNIGEIVDGWRT